MLAWTDLVLGYASYLTAVAWAMPRFARARVPALAMAVTGAVSWVGWLMLPGETSPGGLVARIVAPSLVLLATYRVSGAFFVAPDRAFEQRLLRVDDAVLGRTGLLGLYRETPTIVHELVELLYLLVYAVVPLGATALVLGGRADGLEKYWAVVFAAELVCYAALPWVQTRPPRAIEGETRSYPASPLLRQMNLAVLRVGSIQVNTFPSAHAAGSTAVALAVTSAIPSAGVAFLALALGIAISTVLGRYHYLADSVIGVAVGIAAWALFGA
jgi:membrane-associated phospholipid phosphatase